MPSGRSLVSGRCGGCRHDAIGASVNARARPTRRREGPLTQGVTKIALATMTGTSPRARPFHSRRCHLTSSRPSCGLPGLYPHEFRHTAAWLAIVSGADIKAAQQLLGHASAAMTLDQYATSSATDLTTWRTGWRPAEPLLLPECRPSSTPSISHVSCTRPDLSKSGPSSYVPPAGFEPAPPPPEGGALSPELRGPIGRQTAQV